jgi:hypothetical protein
MLWRLLLAWSTGRGPGGWDNAARAGQAAGGVGDWNSLAISFPKLLYPVPRAKARLISNTLFRS